MALYKYTTKSGQFYGVRFRVVEADGVERHKNLRGFTTQRAARQAQYEYERENSAHLVQKKRDKRVLPVPFCCYSVFNFSAERRTNSACVSPCFFSRASSSAASSFAGGGYGICTVFFAYFFKKFFNFFLQKNRGARYTPTPASKLYIYAIFCIIIHSPVPHSRYYCCVMLTFFSQLRFPSLFAAKPQNCARKR